MDQIVPINEENCAHFIGIPVCAVLNDGTRHYGIISKVRKGKLILNDSDDERPSEPLKPSKSKANSSVSAKGKRSSNGGHTKKPAVQLSAFPVEEAFDDSEVFEPRSPFGAKVSLDMASIAGLFPIL